MELLQQLKQPAREFTPIPFWFLNGDLQEEELERQLKDFAFHGVYGVILHPRMGLPRRIEYLEESFFHYISFIVKTATELEMKVVLYDEGMYPSGSACGKVVEGHPELASEGIGLVQETKEGDEILAQTEEGFLIVRKSGGTLRGIHWGEDDFEPYAPLSADILNPVAVERFIQLTHEQYYRRLKEYFGNTIIGFFTDEPSILGRNAEEGLLPWTHGFADEFQKAGGNLKNLTALFGKEKNKDTELYDHLILAKEGKNYYGKLSKWCEAHGIWLMGHPHQSDDIEVQKYFHVPGQDMVLRWIAPEKDPLSGIDSTMGKCSADAARLMGCRRNSNECFGACNRDDNPWDFTGGDMKWYLDWLGVRGVNLFIPHAYYYSIVGRRKDERPPDVGPNSNWWNHYKKWADYMKRLSFIMTDNSMYTSVAVLCHNRDLKDEAVRPLYEKQIGFQYFPESVWGKCRTDENGFWYENQYYPVVMGDTGRFPNAPVPDLSKVVRDCVCTPEVPTLRAAHFDRCGTECWFLTNEGNDPIDTELLLPTKCEIGSYDMWNGRAEKIVSEAADERRKLRLQLSVRESILLFACTEKEYEELDNPIVSKLTLNPLFKLEEEMEDEVKKVYRAVVKITEDDLKKDSIQICLNAEEMVEMKINGKKAGVQFWAPQRFEAKEFLYTGINDVEITVTGSMANLYGKKYVPYGL